MEQTNYPLNALLIDDEEVIHQSIGEFLQHMGHTVVHAYDGEEGLRLAVEQELDVVICDIRLPDIDGLELLRRLKERSEDLEVILITGNADFQWAVKALRLGAFDFFRKPVELADLTASLQRTRRYQELRHEKDRLQHLLERADLRFENESPLIGESRPMQQIAELVRKVAAAERTTVLIQGESGTGKELVARAIHQNSARSGAVFVSASGATLTESLLESELFGHEAGAFTGARTLRKGLFELGHGGTLFLDEIGDMSAAGQAKLLRVLEERTIRRVGGTREIPVDVRLVAATNHDLETLVDDERFRHELLFRLNVFRIQLPPLRERGPDILLLAHCFLRRFAAEFRKDITDLDEEAQALLQNYPFPGNVRELRNMIERAVILCEGPSLNASLFDDPLAGAGVLGRVNAGTEQTLILEEVEKRTILEALEEAGNQSGAARLLGIGRDALRYRLDKHGIR